MPLPFAASSLSRVLAPAALAMMLAGCAGNSQGQFGAPGTTVDAAAGGQRISDQAVAGVGGPSTGAPAALALGSGPDAIEFSCPLVDVRSGASAWQVPASGGGLRYQASIANLARECTIVESSKTMTMKVGIEGRVLLGDKGTPGAVNVPIRIAVVQEGPNPKTILTKFFTVPVNVPADPGQVVFSVVEDQISFPLTTPGDVEKYIVYVGFDPKGTPAQSRPRPARPRPAEASSAPAATTPATSTSTPPAASTPSSSTSSSSTPSAATPSSSTSSSSDAATFGPPPSAGTFGPPPSTFGPPPSSFGPPPASSSQ